MTSQCNTNLLALLFLTVVSLVVTGCHTKSDQEHIIDLAQNLKHALDNKDYESYIKYMDHPYSGMHTLSKQIFETTLATIQENPITATMFFPNILTNAEFIKLKRDGDWMCYCALTDTNDPEFITINVTLFHKANEKWRWCGDHESYAKGSPDGIWAQRGAAHWATKQEAIDWLDTYPKFKLNYLKDKYLKKQTHTKQ